MTQRRRTETRSKAPVYWRKAHRFARAAHQNAEAQEWDPALSNAIHALINAADAFCVHYRGERSAGDAHEDALDLLAGLDELDAAARQGLGRHLGALLSRKNLAQYEGRLVEGREVQDALKHLDRGLDPVRGIAKRIGWPEERRS